MYFKTITAVCLLAIMGVVTAQAEPYTADWHSLETYNEAPEWFRDAKFGIYFHWGVYSVPAFGNEWYPRHMHIKDKTEHKYHRETYGDPADFGYHDFVPMFTAEHFDAKEWAALFKKSGARYAGPVAEHHDGFAMWDSALTPWNAADKGPQRDITGELAEAIRAEGMRFVTSFHHARNHQHMVHRNGHLKWEGHYPRVEGWPTTSEDPELKYLYGNLPRKEFLELWKGKLTEVIDQYSPDLIWFDSWLDEIPDIYQMEFLAYYFNHAAAEGKDVVVTYKQNDLPKAVALEDFEKGRADKLLEQPWLTDDTISLGSWCYTEKLRIKKLEEVLHTFIDIVSKNGQLLLNISPMADGTIPENQREVLLGMGDWLAAYGEAIYETRPFVVYGEGPTQMEKGGHFVKRLGYTAEDIRYTQKGDTVYVIALGWPGAGKKLRLKAFAADGAAKDVAVTAVTMLNTSDPVKWKRTKKGLEITCPETPQNDLTTVFRLTVE